MQFSTSFRYLGAVGANAPTAFLTSMLREVAAVSEAVLSVADAGGLYINRATLVPTLGTTVR